MKQECNGYSLEIVKAKGKRVGSGWAIKAIVKGKARYRFYHYKVDAERNFSEWTRHDSAWAFNRDFYHNFYSSAELVMPILDGDSNEKSW